LARAIFCQSCASVALKLGETKVQSTPEPSVRLWQDYTCPNRLKLQRDGVTCVPGSVTHGPGKSYSSIVHHKTTAVLLCASLLALTQANASNRGNVFITVQRGGCGIDPAFPLSASIWPNDASGYREADGIKLPTLMGREKITASVSLRSGYYKIVIAGGRCYEDFEPFVVLSGRQRHITVSPNSFIAKPGVDYDIYYPPYGAVAGHLSAGQSHPELIAEAAPTTPDLPRIYEPNVEPDGWYYFDRLFVGKYRLRMFTANHHRSEMEIRVTQNHIIVNW